jgi:hemolysin III
MDKILSKDGSVHVTDERINTIVSLVGSMFAVLLGSILAAKIFATGQPWHKSLALILYILGFINLFVMSTLHHGLNLSKRADSVLRILDYTAIFWHIAATVSVLILFRYAGTGGYAVLTATWLLAAAGISLSATMPKLPKHISNTLFIALGWLPAFVLLAEGGLIPTTELILLAVGGLLYSVGFYIYVSEKPNPIKGIFGFHEIWHIIVLVASLTHWLLIRSLLS